MRVWESVGVFDYVRVCVWESVCKRVRVCVWESVSMRENVCEPVWKECVCLWVCAKFVCVCQTACVYTCMCSCVWEWERERECLANMCVCMSVTVYVSECISVCVCVFVCARMYVNVSVFVCSTNMVSLNRRVDEDHFGWPASESPGFSSPRLPAIRIYTISLSGVRQLWFPHTSCRDGLTPRKVVSVVYSLTDPKTRSVNLLRGATLH